MLVVKAYRRGNPVPAASREVGVPASAAEIAEAARSAPDTYAVAARNLVAAFERDGASVGLEASQVWATAAMDESAIDDAGLIAVDLGRDADLLVLQRLRHRLGIVGRIRQRHHRTIGRLTDHKRHAVFGNAS